MIKATFDENGVPTGFYDPDVSHTIPPYAIPITDEQWNEFLEHQGARCWQDGQVVPYTPVLSPEQVVEQIRATVQAHVDATARERLYDNGNSLASYVASTNPQWTAEAQAFVAWRDAVWAQVYGLWAEPPEPWPTPAAVIADLPAINWPA